MVNGLTIGSLYTGEIKTSYDEVIKQLKFRVCAKNIPKGKNNRDDREDCQRKQVFTMTKDDKVGEEGGS